MRVWDSGSGVDRVLFLLAFKTSILHPNLCFEAVLQARLPTLNLYTAKPPKSENVKPHWTALVLACCRSRRPTIGSTSFGSWKKRPGGSRQFSYGPCPSPKGPRTQILSRVLGSKYHSYYGIWALKSHYLSPWTLRKVNEVGLFPGLLFLV